MTRSKKKSFFQKPSLLKSFLFKPNKLPIRVFSRSHAFLPNVLDRVLHVYNGKKFFLVSPNQNMLKTLAGEFAFTRAFFVPKRKQKKQKKSKKK